MSDFLKRYLTEHVPSMRTAVQHLMRSVERISVRQQRASPGTALPSRLSPGTYPDQVVEDAALSFMGVIDLLEVTDDGAEIADFKSGSLDPTHEEQIRCYSAVWRYDVIRNPEGRPETRLKIAYPSGSIERRSGSRIDDDQHKKCSCECGFQSLRSRLSRTSPLPARHPRTVNSARCDISCDEYWESADHRGEGYCRRPGVGRAGTANCKFGNGAPPSDVIERHDCSARSMESVQVTGCVRLSCSSQSNEDTAEVWIRVGPQSEVFDQETPV